jgi:hypothetical protein
VLDICILSVNVYFMYWSNSSDLVISILLILNLWLEGDHTELTGTSDMLKARNNTVLNGLELSYSLVCGYRDQTFRKQVFLLCSDKNMASTLLGLLHGVMMSWILTN